MWVRYTHLSLADIGTRRHAALSDVRTVEAEKVGKRFVRIEFWPSRDTQTHYAYIYDADLMYVLSAAIPRALPCR